MVEESHEIAYNLLEDRDVQAAVVQAIPSSWCWVDGGLFAPRKLYEEGRITPNTRLALRRFDHIEIVGRKELPFEDSLKLPLGRLEHTVPNIVPLFCGQLHVSSVTFDEVPYECKFLTMNVVRQLAAGFVGLGYVGSLSAYSGFRNNHKYDNPEQLFFSTGRILKLQWDERQGAARRI
ncbi:MAG TPA: hypothetical protein VJG90_03380 [Candidatus Nanoarchaeia archaeon]|nr:hypothetical protein [Candidatus Nanoarchaeia archaeon]